MHNLALKSLYQHGIDFIKSLLPYQFSKTEEAILSKFFSNLSGRVFFIHMLPEPMVAVLLAMYSRMKNPRGIRGIFVDSFLPSLLANLTRECDMSFGGDEEKFLKAFGIKTLEQFLEHSMETRTVFDEFRRNFSGDPEFIMKLGQSEKLHKFRRRWLDKYGHNSIARVGVVHICFEGISILAAKSIEWTRPGAGYIELSTRYVDMSGKDLYPVQNEFEIIGVHKDVCSEIVSQSHACFDIYRELEGSNYDGPLPSFLAEHYGNVVPSEKLKQGVIGETCDLLGNILPCSTLTSLGGSLSGEALPSLIKHLRMDMLPETNAIADMVLSEAVKVGANQFLRHLDTTPWEEMSWTYLTQSRMGPLMLPPRSYVDQVLAKTFKLSNWYTSHVAGMNEVVDKLASTARGEYDKLPREFESVSLAFHGLMSFRGWRDLQRQGLCAHKRGLVSAQNGFYNYSKPAPECLSTAFKRVHLTNISSETQMLDVANQYADKERSIAQAIAQYPLALGNMVPFYIAGNMRQMEFCNWQRSKPSVNHEVREVFLSFEKDIRNAYPWWERISRADMTPAYVFARGDSNVKLAA